MGASVDMFPELKPVTSIDQMAWAIPRFCSVLRLDRRVVEQALEPIPFKTIGGSRVWSIYDALPAIIQRIQLERPRDRLDHYRAERERLKLEQELRTIIPAQEVEQVVGDAFKTIAHALDALPDHLERVAAVSPEGVNIVQHAVDSAREGLYECLQSLVISNDSSGPDI